MKDGRQERRSRRLARARLVLLVVVLVGVWVAVNAGDGLRPADIRAWVAPAGAWAPLLFLATAVGLGLALSPGWLLAGAAGLLFGPALGGGLSLTSATLTAVTALLIARHTGRAGAEGLAGRRLSAAGEWLEHHGFAAVVTVRLAPWLPDSPVNYAAGLTRIRVRHMALGTAVGAAPRAFAYATLGGSLDDLTSPLALGAVGLLGLSAVAGILAVRRAVRRSREARRGIEALRGVEG